MTALIWHFLEVDLCTTKKYGSLSFSIYFCLFPSSQSDDRRLKMKNASSINWWHSLITDKKAIWRRYRAPWSVLVWKKFSALPSYWNHIKNSNPRHITFIVHLITIQCVMYSELPLQPDIHHRSRQYNRHTQLRRTSANANRKKIQFT